MEDLARIIAANKDSLKALAMPEPFFGVLPETGLKLEEFTIFCDPDKLDKVRKNLAF